MKLSCLQTTPASWTSHMLSLQTEPHIPFWQVSTWPLDSCIPSRSLTSPSSQSAGTCGSQSIATIMSYYNTTEPVHRTATVEGNSWWQKWLPTLEWGQSRRLPSVPMQWTLSKRTGPLEADPNTENGNAETSKTKAGYEQNGFLQSSYVLLDIGKFSWRQTTAAFSLVHSLL